MHVLLMILLLAGGTTDVRDELTGHWTGTSICTEPRGACHDEIASYRVTKSDAPDKVTMSLNKMVNGEEQVMGVSDFTVDAQTHTLFWDMESRRGPGRWKFTWNGEQMTGTLTMPPGGRVIRNIAVKRVKD